jgi:hypothetical protein
MMTELYSRLATMTLSEMYAERMFWYRELKQDRREDRAAHDRRDLAKYHLAIVNDHINVAAPTVKQR